MGRMKLVFIRPSYFMHENGNYYFYHRPLGNAQTMTDESGNVVWGAKRLAIPMINGINSSTSGPFELTLFTPSGMI